MARAAAWFSSTTTSTFAGCVATAAEVTLTVEEPPLRGCAGEAPQETRTSATRAAAKEAPRLSLRRLITFRASQRQVLQPCPGHEPGTRRGKRHRARLQPPGSNTVQGCDPVVVEWNSDGAHGPGRRPGTPRSQTASASPGGCAVTEARDGEIVGCRDHLHRANTYTSPRLLHPLTQ